ncbi:MAG: GNAT family N-acetyltransferase [Bacilli bacterium]
MGNYKIVERPPTPEEYRHLCVSVGWESVMNFDVAAKAIDNSLYAVVAVHDEQAVGMGRIVGDGAIFYYIQDIAVSPKHQKQGVGARILDTLMEYLKHHAPEKAFVGLFAAEGSVPFYEQYGFKDYSPSMTGIFRVTPI